MRYKTKTMKTAALFLAAAMLINILSGCGGKGINDRNTITINYGIRGTDKLIAGLAERFPDIDFDIRPSYCANPSGYLRRTLTSGNASDIFFYTQKPDAAEAAEYLLDLSGCDFIGNFDRSVINSYLVDGHIYCIPGPVSLRGVAYNKTLFEEHGWKKPESHRELVELCRQIRAETEDITPIAMSMGGLAYPFSLVTTFSQAGFLGTPAGEEWEKRFLRGEASAAEGWSEGLDMTAELIDAGAFSAADYIGVWDDAACAMEFAEGKAAMFIMWAGQAAMLEMIGENTRYEYAFMPFYGREEGQVMISVSPNFIWGISKRLGEPGNEKKLENALRVLEWLSTPEGEELMMTYLTDPDGNLIPVSAEMSPLSGADAERNASPYFAELWEQADRGNKLTMVYSGYESVIIDCGTVVQEAMLAGSSEGMRERFIAAADADYRDYLSGGETSAVCVITRDMTESETAQLLADGIHEAGLGDLALVTHTGRAAAGIENKRGAGGRYFAGSVSSHDYNIILGDTKNLQVLTLTGERIKRLITVGKRIYNADGTEYADFPYYCGGAEVTRSKDGITVRINGREIEDSAVYRAVFCYNDYDGDTAAAGAPEDTGINLADYWLGCVTACGELSPPDISG